MITVFLKVASMERTMRPTTLETFLVMAYRNNDWTCSCSDWLGLALPSQSWNSSSSLTVQSYLFDLGSVGGARWFISFISIGVRSGMSVACSTSFCFCFCPGHHDGGHPPPFTSLLLNPFSRSRSFFFSASIAAFLASSAAFLASSAAFLASWAAFLASSAAFSTSIRMLFT